MANEVEVYEWAAPRAGVPIRVAPPIAKQVLDITELSAAFNRGTTMVTIIASAACRIQFSPAAGTDPDGSTMTIRLVADQPQDYAVIAGRKVIVVAA